MNKKRNINDYNLVNVDQAAELLGVSRPTLFRMVKRKMLIPLDFPHLKLPVLLFDKQDVLDFKAWLKDNVRFTFRGLNGSAC